MGVFAVDKSVQNKAKNAFCHQKQSLWGFDLLSTTFYTVNNFFVLFYIYSQITLVPNKTSSKM